MYGQKKYKNNSTRSTHALIVAYIALALSVLGLVTKCKGQLGSWNILNVKYNFNQKFSLFAEGQVRSLRFYDQFHYHEYKGGFNYKVHPSTMLTLAAGHYDTYKEGGNFVTPKNIYEFRIWPQIILNQTIGVFKIEHRYRAELRFTNIGYHNRFRYRLGIFYPFGKEKNGYKPFQINVTDEIFFTDTEPFFQRNRFWAYLNYKVSNQVYFQAGYVYQIDYKINDETGRQFLQVGVYIELTKKQKQ